MNWLEKHLNWTGLGIAVLTPAVFWILLVFMGGVYGFNIDYWIDVDREIIFTVILIIFTYSFLILHSIGFLWILRKKSRSLWFLLFYLPSFIPVVPSLIYSRGDEVTLMLWQFLGFLIIYIGWFVLILLKNRSYRDEFVYSPQETQIISSSRIRQWLSRHIVSYFAITLAIIMIVASSVSFIYMRTGTSTYEYPYSESADIPRFSFEHPVSVNVFELHSGDIFGHYPGNETVFGIVPDGTFTQHDIHFAITIFPLNKNIEQLTDILSTVTLPGWVIIDGVSFPLPLWCSQFTIQNLQFNPVFINDTQALRSTIHDIEMVNHIESDQTRGTYSVYLLESHEYLWVIELIVEGEDTVHPPQWFESLLESFTVYDN